METRILEYSEQQRARGDDEETIYEGFEEGIKRMWRDHWPRVPSENVQRVLMGERTDRELKKMLGDAAVLAGQVCLMNGKAATGQSRAFFDRKIFQKMGLHPDDLPELIREISMRMREELLEKSWNTTVSGR